MSTRDKKLLIILAGVAILALTYFLIFIPQSNKRDSLKSENMNLKSQYNQLSALAAKADDYTEKTKDMSDAMQQVYDNLADDWSRDVFAASLNYKLSGKLHYLWQSETERLKDLQSIFSWSEEETYADLGAYNGDTIREFLQLTNNKYNRIFAAEPDRRNYKKLSAYLEASGLSDIKIFERAIWKETAELSFSDSGGRQSTLLTGQRHIVQAVDIDTLLEDERVTYIKMDVEGAEMEALKGGKEQIKRNKPKLFIAAYHHDADIFLLPLFMWQLVPEYKVYLRKHPYVPAWELNFLAVV